MASYFEQNTIIQARPSKLALRVLGSMVTVGLELPGFEPCQKFGKKGIQNILESMVDKGIKKEKEKVIREYGKSKIYKDPNEIEGQHD